VGRGRGSWVVSGSWDVGSWPWVVDIGRWSLVVGRAPWVVGGRRSSVVDEVVGRRSSVVGRESLVVGRGSWAVVGRRSLMSD